MGVVLKMKKNNLNIKVYDYKLDNSESSHAWSPIQRGVYTEKSNSVATDIIHGSTMSLNKNNPYGVIVDFRTLLSGENDNIFLKDISTLDEYEDLQSGKAKLIIDESPETSIFEKDYYLLFKQELAKHTKINPNNVLFITGEIKPRNTHGIKVVINQSYWQDVYTAYTSNYSPNTLGRNPYSSKFIKLTNEYTKGFLRPYKYAYHVFRPRLSRLCLFKLLQDDSLLKDGWLSFPKLDKDYRQLGDDFRWNDPGVTNRVDGVTWKNYEWHKLYDDIAANNTLPLGADVAPSDEYKDETHTVTTHQVAYTPSNFMNINLYTQIYTEVQIETYVSISDNPLNLGSTGTIIPSLLTEKTYRPFAMGIPGFIFAAQGTYEYLRDNFDFYVGDDYIDLSFDKIENSSDRFEAFYKSLKSFISKPREELEILYRTHYDKWMQNHDMFFSKLKKKESTRMFNEINGFINE